MTIKNSGGRPTLRPGKTMFRTAGAQGMVGDVPFYHTVIPGFWTFIAPQKMSKMTVSAPPFPSVFKRDSIPPPHGKPGYSSLTGGEFLAWWYFERLVVLCGSSHICFQKS